MNLKRLADLFEKIKTVRAALVGDVCLDAYWQADMRRSELSRETPHYSRPVVSERYSCGALANVAANLEELGVSRITLFTVLGRDWRGDILLKLLKEREIDTDEIQWEESRLTPTFLKPILTGYQTQQEAERFDFLSPRPPREGILHRLFMRLAERISDFDCILIGDQVLEGVITDDMIGGLTSLAETNMGVVFTVDSRYRIDRFSHMVWKPNEIEAAKALEEETEHLDYDSLMQNLLERQARLIFMTVGERGCLVGEGNSSIRVPAFSVSPPIDFVGAGDSFHAAMAACLAAGSSAVEAGIMGNMAASVTVKKIGITGTASPDEIIEVFKRHQKGNT